MLEISIGSIIFVAFCMVFMHIIADYIVQTDLLAKLKVDKNWDQIRKDNPQFKWKYDYKMVLFLHSFSWAFMVMLPMFLIESNVTFIAIGIAYNTVIHMVIDDLKANKHTITFLADQLMHFGQIIVVICFYIFS